MLTKTLLLTLALTPAALAQTALSSEARPSINVVGEAVVYVVPDKIIIEFGVETSDIDINLAKARNNEILKRALASIDKLGVPHKDVQTDHLSVEPRYQDEYLHSSFVGYFVRCSFVVTLHDPAKVEELVSTALSDGVNYIHGVEFQTTEFKKHREQARTLALQAAREKAEKMSAVLGMKVGDPLLIHDQHYAGVWRYRSSWNDWGYSRHGGMSQNRVPVYDSPDQMSETIALGKIAVNAQVNVTFQIHKAP